VRLSISCQGSDKGIHALVPDTLRETPWIATFAFLSRHCFSIPNALIIDIIEHWANDCCREGP
jgi:hypothetical protein